MDNFDISNYNFFHQLKLLPFVQKIYLYGSRAKGDSTPSSDIDIAISWWGHSFTRFYTDGPKFC